MKICMKKKHIQGICKYSPDNIFQQNINKKHHMIRQQKLSLGVFCKF